MTIEKIAVKDWPIPCSKKHSRISYYRKFVKGFSSIAEPFYALTENQTKFVWEDQYQKSFDTLKRTVTSMLIFCFLKEKREFIFLYWRKFWNWCLITETRRNWKKLSLILVESLLNKTESNYCLTRPLSIESVKFFYHLICTDIHFRFVWIMFH